MSAADRRCNLTTALFFRISASIAFMDGAIAVGTALESPLNSVSIADDVAADVAVVIAIAIGVAVT